MRERNLPAWLAWVIARSSAPTLEADRSTVSYYNAIENRIRDPTGSTTY
jgi:hypothetical protein